MIKKRFFISLLGFTPYWDNKPTNAFHSDSPGVNTSEKMLNLSALGKIHLNCMILDGSMLSGLSQPIIFGFVLDKPTVIQCLARLKQDNIKKRQNSFQFL